MKIQREKTARQRERFGKKSFADFQTDFFKFTEHLRETPAGKSILNRKPFMLQNEFRKKLTKRFGESKRCEKFIENKSSKSRAEIWLIQVFATSFCCR